MIRKQILLLLAIAGIVATFVVVIRDRRPSSVPAPLIRPASAPFAAYVSGTGMVEASNRNVAVGTPVAGIVKQVNVAVGQRVKAGDILFVLDDRDLQAQLLTATAAVKAAAAALREPRHRLENAEHLWRTDHAAIREQDLSDLRDQAARAEAELELARAQVGQIKLEMERRIVRAPMSGTILQTSMRPGEYVAGGNTATPSILMGDDARLQLRVEIDANEAWRVRSGAAAEAYVRGHPEQGIRLHFEHIEPYVIPKSAFTGQSTERTDRRVLQVVYSFDRGERMIYVGQLLDVYIETSADIAPSSKAGR